ncbi:MAG TPA: FxLYD domain-containing protein, partial [Alphaproteobacteria bacterium]|nr:FxLYD domain-containing protein [Alphaproteobacteria bacterium]
VGILKNTTDREYGYVQIQFNLYDKDGVQVGSTLANVNNLEPQSTWKFEAGIIEENVTMFKVKDITGF